ncbi:Gfo/Idh/MocA family oxidoreductase [bacterium]|nr:Gfo/Idh/MocA family oxidoreductase [bacterium]
MKIGILSFANANAWKYARSAKALGIELLGITDENEERGRKASEELGVSFIPTKEEFLSLPIDAVIICSENVKHKDDVLLCAQAKKHILCEMPLAISLQDAQIMLQHCEENSVFLIPALPYRYSPPLQRTKEILKEGQIGEVVAMKATCRSKLPHGWQATRRLAGGGAIIQNAPLMIDIMRWLIEDDVAEVYAEIARSPHLNIDVEDVATLSFRFKGGVFATLDPSWCLPDSYPFPFDATIDIVGREGALIVNLFAQLLSHIDENTKSFNWRYWGSDIYLLMLKDFSENISEGEAALKASDALKALQVAWAGLLSGEKQEPVTL